LSEEKKGDIKLYSRTKIWIEVEDEVVFGNGRLRLFKAINETNSIRQAAEKMGMSYRAAWGKIKATEERLGLKLTEKQVGGKDNGTRLTQQAYELILAYEKYRDELQKSSDKLFEHHFNKFNI
jgi:molybdate transport system regulatory protein